METKEVKLKDICCKVVSGGTPLTSNKDYYFPETVPWLKTGEVNYRNIYETENFISEEGLKKSSAKLIPINSVIVAMYGQGDTAGRVAVNKIPLCTNQACCNLIINENLAHYGFIFYYLWTQYQQLVLYKTGGAQPNLNIEKIKNLKIKLPPLSVQQKIANILSLYDEAIENNSKRIKLLEQMAQNLYKEWFVRFRFPGWQNAEFENGMPKGWKIQKLENFGIILESGSRPSGGVDTSLEDGIPSLGAECVNGLAEFDYSNIKYIPQEFYEKMKRGKNKRNHILLYKDGAYIGKVTLFRNKFPFEKYAINEHVFFLNTTNENYMNWLYFTLNQESYFNLMQNLNRNAAQPGLSQLDINRIKIRIPSEDVVIKFNKFVEPILNTVFTLAKLNQNLAKQRDLLLPRLMSGRLEV